jgi:hypothetical protein
MTTKKLLKLATDLQAVALVEKNIKLLKKKKKKLAKTALDNIIGIEMIKAQSDIVAGF